MAKPALLITGEMMPLVMRGCEAHFEVKRYWEAPDRDAFVKQVGPSIRAICTGSFTGRYARPGVCYNDTADGSSYFYKCK